MPASTSTVTTAGSENGNVNLRVEKEKGNGKENVGWEKHEKDFYWTYTEEPHRTRRMAIIKAHPEVCPPFPSPPPKTPNHPIPPSFLQHSTNLLSNLGNQTLRSRAPNQISRSRRRTPPNPHRVPPTKHAFLELEVLGRSVCDWGNGEPESVFGDP